MLKIAIVIATTAVLAFGVGVWTGSRVLAVGALPPAAATISPTELHLKINPSALEEVKVDNYN